MIDDAFAQLAHSIGGEYYNAELHSVHMIKSTVTTAATVWGTMISVGAEKGGEPLPLRQSEVNRILGTVDELAAMRDRLASELDMIEHQIHSTKTQKDHAKTTGMDSFVVPMQGELW